MDADAKMMLPLFSMYVMFDADSAPVCVSLMFAVAVVGVLLLSLSLYRYL